MMDYRYGKAELARMSPESLIEGFLRESKLVEASLNGFGSEEEGGVHVAAVESYAAVIRERGGLPSLAPLLESDDPFIAYSVARLLARTHSHREAGIATLARVADLNSGVASVRADRSRNLLLYGDTLGDPVEVEKRLAEIRAREKPSTGDRSSESDG